MSDERFNKLDSKIDKLDERLDSIDKTLVRQEEQLAYHIKRTNLLEADLKPVKRHVAHIEGVFKFLGIMATIATIAAALIQVLK